MDAHPVNQLGAAELARRRVLGRRLAWALAAVALALYAIGFFIRR